MSITTPQGFVAAGVAAGVKASGALDLALLATEDAVPVSTAATFTTNRAAAAPVVVSRAHLEATGGLAAAVVVNSGNANAATGRQGREDAALMCARAGARLGVAPEAVLVCSTGLIGIPLPIAAVEAAIPALVDARADSADASVAAATAILTTDSGRKEVEVAGTGWSVAGMAKGAGMLAPRMATMLAFLTTDVALDPDVAARVLRHAVDRSFNVMTVDGCTSTNDTVVLMASGRAGPADLDEVTEAVTAACSDLATQMAGDAEGASKVAHVRVRGARSDGDAQRAARRVAESLLVKCSLNGADPYWGRVLSELGASGAELDPDRVSIAYGGIVVCRDGIEVAHDAAAVAAHLAGDLVEIGCDLGLGDGSGMVMTVDLGQGYLDENRTTS
ncbi:MAG: bifunctional glutamate N-acetyltransferase/amino-acid acetyltransferase ArgJ [Actinomycetota bacterium]|jgi:glutamate N-acetyltransferase/amino-acid N-acetyltransferase|nr:bifunctional glutamate N-acetyltransferase/amino-acid acetyltransferase ArgJ [Actinomycetota bacterium]